MQQLYDLKIFCGFALVKMHKEKPSRAKFSPGMLSLPSLAAKS